MAGETSRALRLAGERELAAWRPVAGCVASRGTDFAAIGAAALQVTQEYPVSPRGRVPL